VALRAGRALRSPAQYPKSLRQRQPGPGDFCCRSPAASRASVGPFTRWGGLRAPPPRLNQRRPVRRSSPRPRSGRRRQGRRPPARACRAAWCRRSSRSGCPGCTASARRAGRASRCRGRHPLSPGRSPRRPPPVLPPVQRDREGADVDGGAAGGDSKDLVPHGDAARPEEERLAKRQVQLLARLHRLGSCCTDRLEGRQDRDRGRSVMAMRTGSKVGSARRHHASQGRQAVHLGLSGLPSSST